MDRSAESQVLTPASLPVDVIEAVCQELSLQDRVAFTCCCRMLWAEPEVLSSSCLWGDIRLDVDGATLTQGSQQQQQATKPTVCRVASLGAWLLRRQAALRRLRLCGSRDSLAAVVCSLGSCPLQDFELARRGHAPYRGPGHTSALVHVAGLTSLTRLSICRCGIRALPEELSALRLLRVLELGGNPLSVGKGAGPLGTLRHLSSLRRLDLSGCGVTQLPSCAQLSALQGLQELELNNNFGFGEEEGGGGASGGSLSVLASLSRLDLSFCGLRSLPPDLSALHALADLDLQGNEALGCARGETWEPLAYLPVLTRLRLSRCGLEVLPEQVSALTLLADLEVGGNHYLGKRRDAAFRPLQNLSALTRLGAAKCGVDAVPDSVTTLYNLAELDLSYDPGIGAYGHREKPALRTAWAQLGHLAALTRLRTGYE